MRRAARPRALFAATLVLAGLLLAAGCVRVPYSGRPQQRALPESLVRAVGRTAADGILEAPDSLPEADRDRRERELLREVGNRLAATARFRRRDWTFHLVDRDTAHAWALPGGTVAIHTGLLPAARSEAGLAWVLAHAMGHLLAHHLDERLAPQLAVLGGPAGLRRYAASPDAVSSEQRAILHAVLATGTGEGPVLPFSVRQEVEADIIGLMTLAAAGYPPEAAPAFLERLPTPPETENPPPWSCIHPSDPARQAALAEWMPRARRRHRRHALPADTRAPRWEP